MLTDCCHALVIGVKRIKYRSDEDDDDDFEVVSYKAQTKHVENTTSNSEPDDSSELRRVSLKWLIEAMHNLNPQQRSVVEDMGFGHLF